MKSGVRVFRSPTELSASAAEHAAAVLAGTTAGSGRCRLVLAGGETPKTLYQVLASRFRESVRWEGIHVFWGDERYVPHTDPRSNYRMARETLLDHVPCPAHQIHPMPTHFSDPAEAAREYDGLLDVDLKGGAEFDLVLLGLGADAHTASIFPDSPALDDGSHWALAVTAPIEPARRLTLTMRALTRAKHIMILAAGTSKAAALLGTTADLTWWVDEPAAAGLGHQAGREVAHG